jgi:type III secretory pathway component EscS
MDFKWNPYKRNAVVIPAILILLPFAVLHYYYLDSKIQGIAHLFDILKTLSRVALPLAFLLLITNTARLIGKGYFEKRYFKDSLYMPTSTLLLYSDQTLSKAYKQKIRARIKEMFAIRLLSEADEEIDELEARRTIADAVGYIRNRVKDGYMLLKYNIFYGFWRNLVGGSVIGLFICIINFIIFGYIQFQPEALWLTGAMAAVYITLLISSKWATGVLGRMYARRLYEEFMSLT